mmetsp:Transcript_33679/g.77751  ORF Transcript_33679/g.77751 Transcript_33679/m.77751 type:complete len:502 (+) Transcript_33679:121-1626(+)
MPESSAGAQTTDDLPRRGFFARIAHDKTLENVTLFVIVLNAVWMFIDVEWNHDSLRQNGVLPLEPWSTVVENYFCGYFTVEIVIRFFGFRTCLSCCKDAWFMFDLALVILMVLETWVLPLIELAGGGGSDLSDLSPLRLLRLLRLSRLARFMRFFPELLTLVRGMARAMQSVAWILLFLLIVTYVFAIIFTSQLGTPGYTPPPDSEDQTAPELFSDMGSGMMSLFTHGILGDNLHYFLLTLQQDSVLLMWCGMIFMILCGISLLNMLIGILCQVIADSSEEEAKAQEQATLERLLQELFEAADVNGDGEISAEEWSLVASSDKCLQLLKRLQLDERKPVATRLAELQSTIFGGGEGSDSEAELEGLNISIDQFKSQVLDLRKDAKIGHFDLRRLETRIQREDHVIESKLVKLHAEIEQLLRPREGDKPGPESPRKSSSMSPKKSVTRHLLPGQPEEAQPLPGQPEEEAAPAQPLKPGWLREVPTPVLLDVLRSRAGELWQL